MSGDSDFPGGHQVSISRSGHILERKCPCLWLGWEMGGGRSIQYVGFHLSFLFLVRFLCFPLCLHPHVGGPIFYSFLNVQLSPGLCRESSVWSGRGHQTSNCFQTRLSRDLSIFRPVFTLIS